MNKNYLRLSLVLVVAISMIVSCKKYDPDKIASTAWNPNLAVPLAHGHFTVYDILAKTDSNDVVIIDPATGAIALVYRGEIVSFEAADLVDMIDYSTTVSLGDGDYGIGVSAAYSGTANGNQSNVVNPSLNSGVELYTSQFKSGNLSIGLSTDLQHDVDVTISIPDLLEGGVTPFSRTITMTYSGSVPQTGSELVDLSGAIMDFTNGGGSFNEFDIQTDVTISGTGQPVTGTESVDVQFDFTALEFEKCTGYFGQQSIAVDNDSILLKIFDNDPDGYFELVDPRVRFTVTNEMGFPAEISLSNLETIDASTGTAFVLGGYPSTLDVAAPTAMGDYTTTVLQLDQTNTTNITTVITPTPKWFYFEGSGTSNPNGNVGTNFLIDTSVLRIDAEVEMPMEGFAYGFTVSDTIEFSFSEEVEYIESLMFRINVDNGFPVELLGQAAVLDSNKNVLFTLWDAPENIIASAPVDGNGRVTESFQKITDIYLDQDQINQIGNAAYLVIGGDAQSLSGPSGEIVKLFEDYVIDLRVGMQVQGKFNL
ncbi:hypothetical protein [Parvicella tangerina]|uniref:Uncharacterized protein n=1 Tax=Parvicella tangerina TaxID=2829795 RepID=A0A916JQ08_9FLAO|nr:hypothetical protein [Parvicella tangerina]CAG5085495.1 hypothetical protein CRYO30217_02774 [Parvicella tangerina]